VIRAMVKAKTGRSGALRKGTGGRQLAASSRGRPVRRTKDKPSGKPRSTLLGAAPADVSGEGAAWAEAERLYADRAVKISAIAALVGLAPIQLSRRAKDLGWPMRTQASATRGKRLTPGSTKKSCKAQSKKPLKPLELVQRVYRTIEGELTKLENQEGTSSQDRERGSRALSQIVNSLEKATDMQQVLAAKTAKGGTAKDKEALAHAEDLRRQIAERLERLSRKRDDSKRAEGDNGS
jgi:hypothetical protein